MRFAICYSGNLRSTRMMLDNHVKYLLQPLIQDTHHIDIFLYTDNFNTARYKSGTGFNFTWQQTPLNPDILADFIRKLSPYSGKPIKQVINPISNQVINQVSNPISKYKQSHYLDNIIAQMEKFKNVLELVYPDNMVKLESYDDSELFLQYDWIIRLRPDVYFISSIISQITFHDINQDQLYQNRECVHNYNGDSIQIFHYSKLSGIIKKLSSQINLLYDINKIQHDDSKYIYESMIIDIFKQNKLQLIWIDNLVCRWIDKCTIYFPLINIEYIKDWTSLEYKYTFTMSIIEQLINIRKKYNNLLILDDIFLENESLSLSEISKNKLYLAALNPDIYQDNNYTKNETIGLIPCSGTATRMNGIPKFLLPYPSISTPSTDTSSKVANLINNSIDIFKQNGIDDIYISVSKENEHFIKPLNAYDNKVKYMVRNTSTMSETVMELIKIPATKYILIMPDTYFLSGKDTFPELTEMNVKLNKYDIVVILWKIKEYQYGKLGQIEIDEKRECVVGIMDKNPDCRYPYSWGVIGWTRKTNKLINPETPHIGYIINSALENGLNIGYVLANNTEYYDCGTPSEYFKMIKDLS